MYDEHLMNADFADDRAQVRSVRIARAVRRPRPGQKIRRPGRQS